MSALYMSMSANDSDMVIEDELAKGMLFPAKAPALHLCMCVCVCVCDTDLLNSAKDSAGLEV